MAFAFRAKTLEPTVGLKLNFIRTPLPYTRTAEFFARAGILLSGLYILAGLIMNGGLAVGNVWAWFNISAGISSLVASVILGVLAEISRSVASLREL